MLHDQAVMYCSEYHLMKQFEQFYFRLTGVEQFQEGGIKRIEKVNLNFFQNQWTFKAAIVITEVAIFLVHK